jgi:hypothetical protein
MILQFVRMSIGEFYFGRTTILDYNLHGFIELFHFSDLHRIIYYLVDHYTLHEVAPLDKREVLDD